jgi:hypothetical protein
MQLFENGLAVPLFSGRLGIRVHVGSYSSISRAEPPHYALCSASLPFKTRSEPAYSVASDRMCPVCLKRAKQKGMVVEDV